MAKKRSLGKGLGALITAKPINSGTAGFNPNLPIDYIVPNPYQPRSELKPEQLVELSDSIREHGVIEPLIVTKVADDQYELIAGERRWRASKLAGLKQVPVVIKEATPQEMLELAIIENVQREDLNAFEEALAFEQLVTGFGLTHAQVAQKVGLSRPAIANKIRLLALPDEVKKGLLDQKISEGHARALLGLKTEEAMINTFKIIQRDGLSVRAVEEIVRRLNKGKMKQRKTTNRIIDEKTLELEGSLKSKFGTKVSLSRTKKGGKIVIPFDNDEELDQITSEIL